MNTPIPTRSTNRKWQFKTRTLFYAIAIVAMFMFAIGYVNRLQLWRDTIFHSDQNATLELPLGETFKANQWITTPKSLSLTFLITSNSKEFLLVQNTDNSKTATMIVDGERFEAIVTDYRFRGPSYRAEYWIRPGKKIGPE
jgi:hypothetical protein